MKNLKNKEEASFIISGLKNDLASIHGFDGAEISLKTDLKGTVCYGEALIPSIFEKLKARLKGTDQEDGLSFSISISSLKERMSNTRLWMPKYDWINLYSSAKREKLSIQLQRNDPPSVMVCQNKSLAFLWTPFTCYGWTECDNLEISSRRGSSYILRKGQSIFISRDELLKFKEYLRINYLEKGIKYRLGSSSHSEVDCSGFIMRAVYDRFGVCLPKHSEDQYGTIGYIPDNIRDLDIIYARSILRGNKHIAFVYFEGDEARVLEASYRKKQVITCSLDNFRQRFNITGIKRLFAIK